MSSLPKTTSVYLVVLSARGSSRSSGFFFFPLHSLSPRNHTQNCGARRSNEQCVYLCRGRGRAWSDLGTGVEAGCTAARYGYANRVVVLQSGHKTYSIDIAATRGAICLQGPHQVVNTSITTNLSPAVSSSLAKSPCEYKQANLSWFSNASPTLVRSMPEVTAVAEGTHARRRRRVDGRQVSIGLRVYATLSIAVRFERSSVQWRSQLRAANSPHSRTM